MRRFLIAGACILAAGAATAADAQTGAPVPMTAATQAAPAAESDDPLDRANAVIEQLTAQLNTANAEIARLQPLAAGAAQDKQLAEQCTAKNVRLVRAGQDILAAYVRRYGRRMPDPLQLNRRAFEEEAQALGDRLYDNRYDVAADKQRPESASPAPEGDK